MAVGACAAVTLPADRAVEVRVVDVRAGRFASEAQLVDALANAHFRLLGERHDNPVHHAIRAQLIRAIAGAGRRPAVVFEQFDIENDAALRSAQRERAGAEALADAGRLDRKGWEWPLHRPVLEAALEAGLPVRAGNVSRAQIRERSQRADRPFAGVQWSAAQQAKLAEEIVEGHCGKLPAEAVPRLVIAQRLRDDAMANALAEAASDDGAILVAGNGHVRNDLGVTPYLRARRPDASVISVGLVEVERVDGPRSPAELAARHPGFDYLWLTDSVARPDPCEAFRSTVPR
jgi:uncharacterized iron-regulated protein